MTYTLAPLDDGQIIVLTLSAEFDIANGMRQVSQECLALLEQSPDRVVLISDSRQVSINNLNDVIAGANVSRQPEPLRVIRHPKVIKLISVVNSRVVQVAVRGLNSASFGHLEIPIFETVEEAIDAARRHLAEGKSPA